MHAEQHRRRCRGDRREPRPVRRHGAEQRADERVHGERGGDVERDVDAVGRQRAAVEERGVDRQRQEEQGQIDTGPARRRPEDVAREEPGDRASIEWRRARVEKPVVVNEHVGRDVRVGDRRDDGNREGREEHRRVAHHPRSATGAHDLLRRCRPATDVGSRRGRRGAALPSPRLLPTHGAFRWRLSTPARRAPGLAAAVFPRDSLGLISMFSQVGLILFMFLVGLEFDGTMLRGRGHTSVVISHTSIIVPFALGAVLARYLYPRLSPPTVPFSSFTLFMGAAMSITAFPVLARILVERRLLHSKLGAVAITCAAVDDVTAWCILAFVVSIVRAGSLGDAARTTGLALLYICAMLALVRPFLRRLAGRSANKEGLSQNLVAMTLVLLLLSSLTTEVIGIHALFGAFMIGSIIPKANGFAQILADKLEDLVVVFLLPLFFAYSGLRTQIGLLDSLNAWWMCGLVVG